MIRPTFKTPDFKKLIAELEKQGEEKLKEARQEIEDAADAIVLAAKEASPINESRLRNSISKKELSAYQWEIVADSKYAAFMEFGTRSSAELPPGTEAIAADVKAAYERSKAQGKEGNLADMERNIRRWVRRKGLAATYSVKTKRRQKVNKAEEAREEAIVFLVMRKILKVGVKPQPFFYPAIARIAPVIEKKLEKIIKK